MSKRLRIVVSGVGNRALPKNPGSSNWLGWVEQIKRSKQFDLVAAHDVDEASLQRIVERGYLKLDQVYLDLDQMLSAVSSDAMVVCNPAEFHAVTIKKAFGKNMHVLVEKPFVQDLADAEEILRLQEKNKRIVAVVQNWRTKDIGLLLKKSIEDGLIGQIGYIFFRYIRNRENPNYPAYILKESYPLLHAMSSHHLDLFRFILGDEFTVVSGHSFKPAWSLYDSDTSLNLYLETDAGIKVIYSGTISSQSLGLPQESLIVGGEKGTLVNESEWLEPPLLYYPRGRKETIDLGKDIVQKDILSQYNQSDQRILENFYFAILGQQIPVCSSYDAANSINVLRACKLACETQQSMKISNPYCHFQGSGALC